MSPSTHFWLRFAAVFLIALLYLVPRGWLRPTGWFEAAPEAPVAHR